MRGALAYWTHGHGHGCRRLPPAEDSDHTSTFQVPGPGRVERRKRADPAGGSTLKPEPCQ